MRERKQGRPPSYPSVVTTTTTTENIHGNAGTSSGGGPDYTFNGNFSAGTGVVHLSTAASASSDVSTGGGTDIEKPVMSLESALGIYQRRKDAETCLKEYRRAYDRHDCRNRGHDSSEGVDDNGSGENTREKNVEAGATLGPLSRRHNEAVLAHLSMLRSRRRRRPSSFDVTSSDNLSFDKSKGETNEKSSEKSDASNDDMARLLSTMLNISYAGSSVGGIDTANVAPLDSEFRTSNASSDTSKSRERKKEKKKNDGDIPESPPSKLSRYNRLVATYNLCLTRFASGKYAEALCDEISVPLLQEMNLLARLGDEEGIDGDDDHSATVQSAGMPDIYDLDEKNHHFLRNLAITTRLGFLVLDCILARLCGNGVGLSLVPIRWDDPSVETNDGLNDDEVKCLEDGVIMSNISANSILSWIEKNSLPVAMSDRNSVFLSQYDLGYHELKFNLHLYRSRVLFVRDSEIVDDPADSGVSQSGSGSDGNGDLAARARISRKELKSAMDIFQNKLLIEEEMKDQYDIHADCRGRGDGSRNNSSKVGKLATEGNRGRKNSISSHRRNNSNGKYHTQDGSETTSVTSMAGGSFVTSLSDALWSDGKGVAVPRATFEGMPNKLSNAQNTHSEQTQGQLSSMLTSSNVSATKKKSDNPDLEARHELALFLKGNLEYLRGNATKSLKLCIEARLAGKKSLLGGRDEQNRRDRAEIAKNNDGLSESMPNGINDYSRHQLDANTRLEKLMMNEYDLAIYYNNLALVHQAEGKVHIALHYYSLALSSMERVHNLDEKKSTQLRISNNTNFWSDGIARPDFSAEMLNNASICAFQANDFKIAYECMARCIMISPDVFGKRARCWLRMGQSFIGIHALSPQKDSAAKRRDNSEGYFVSTTTTFDELAQLVGENEIETGFRNDGDLTVAFENPLRRASFCLQRAMRLSNPNINARTGKEDETLPMHCSDIHCFETSVLSLAYINLELDHPYEVIELCRLLIESNVDRPQFSDDKLVNRNRAIAKVYSCEALCRTANSQGALAAIIGDNHDIDGAVEVLTEEIVKDAGGGGAVEAQYIAHSTVAGSLACAGDAHNAAHCASLISGNVDPGGVLEDGYPEDSFLERRVRLFSLLNGSDGKGKNDDTIGE